MKDIYIISYAYFMLNLIGVLVITDHDHQRTVKGRVILGVLFFGVPLAIIITVIGIFKSFRDRIINNF
jgi:hypothetical protein